MTIKIREEARTALIASIRRYFTEELEQDIGELKAGFLLDYVFTEIGPVVYNSAIADAQAYFQQRAADLDGVCFEPELAYWNKSSRRSMG